MVRLKKIYMIAVCTVICLSGCNRTEEAVFDEVAVTDAETLEEKKPETAEREASEKNADDESENVLHPITEEGINYLSVDDIFLEPGTQISMVGTDSQNSFYSTVRKGAAQAVADLNTALGYSGKEKVSFSFAAPKKEDVVDQINIIDQLLDKAPDALCIAFADATACKTQVQMAEYNGIKLIAFDTPDESRTAEALVATDNVAAAAGAAGQLFDTLENGDKVAVIVHSSAKQTGHDRYRAITGEYLSNHCDKNLRFVDIVYMMQDDRSTEEIFEELLEKHPDLSGIICTDIETTEKTLEYVKKLTDQKISIVGFGVSEKIVNAVKDGTLLGTVAQDPYSMGYATVIAAARSIAGMENAQSIHSAHLWIDASNVESEEAQSLYNFK